MLRPTTARIPYQLVGVFVVLLVLLVSFGSLPTVTASGATPTPTETPTNTPVPTETPTNTPEPTLTPTETPTNIPEPTFTPTETPTNTPVPPTATNTPAPPPPTATNTAPEIALNLSEIEVLHDAPPQVTTGTLTIGNTGQMPLNWSLSEGDAESTGVGECNLTTDLTWFTITPTSGTTGPNGVVATVFTLDSTDLSAGVYSGTLCVNSNDLNDFIITIPLQLTVADPTAIDLNTFVSSPVSRFNATDLAAAGVLLLAGVAVLLRRR